MERIVRNYVQRGHLVQGMDRATQTSVKRLKVAAYCRVSTDSDEQLNSYDVQVEYYSNYIKSNKDWTFAGIYADEGITGTAMRKRKNFLRMIEDAMAGRIDLIIVKSVSRFARNTVDSLSTVRELREKGVKIFFEKENIDSLDAKCDMILSIYSSLAEEESRSISTNIRWSVQKRFEKGQVIMNFNNLYGYTVDENKKPIIKEQEAEVVRDIYFKFLEGYTFADIISDLKKQGIPSPKGHDVWSKSTLNSILNNEKYAGDALLQKTYKRDFLSSSRVKNTGQAPQKYVENNHTAIIDREIWNAVQAEIKRRNSLRSCSDTGKGRYSGQYAFSGRLVCGNCGAEFRRHNYINNNKKEAVWTCKQHIRSKMLCPQLPIKERWLENVFLKTLNGLIRNKQEILHEIEQSVGEAISQTASEENGSDALNALDRQIQTLQEQLLSFNKRRQRREMDAEAYNAESRAVMDKLDTLFIERDKLAAKTDEGALHKAWIRSVTEFIENVDKQVEFDKDIFIKLVDLVIVKSRDHIVFQFKNGITVKADTDVK